MKNNEKPAGVAERQPGPRQTRRDFVRRAVYATPAILSLPAAPSFAQTGSGGGTGGGDSGTGNPGNNGPFPASEANCDNPLTPIDNDVATSMCEITTDTGQQLYQDIIVAPDAVPARAGRGDVIGTCDAFLCNSS